MQTISQWGWLGVHVFFAISGWCITERIATTIDRGEGTGMFLIERLLRIFPTYWAAIAATLLIRLMASVFNTAAPSTIFPAGIRGWLGTLLLMDPYIGTIAYLTVSWSLVYELGFYFC